MSRKRTFTNHQARKWNREVDNLLDATQKPFDNRCQAAIYTALSILMAQEDAQKVAKMCAERVVACCYIDVDREPSDE